MDYKICITIINSKENLLVLKSMFLVVTFICAIVIYDCAFVKDYIDEGVQHVTLKKEEQKSK